MIRTRHGSAQRMDSTAASHHEHSTTNFTKSLYSKPLTHIPSVPLFSSLPATVLWTFRPLCTRRGTKNAAPYPHVTVTVSITIRMSIHRKPFNRRQKFQSETKYYNWTISLRLNFSSLPDFLKAKLTVKEKCYMFTVSITIWNYIQSKKFDRRQSTSIGDKKSPAEFLFPIELFVSD